MWSGLTVLADMVHTSAVSLTNFLDYVKDFDTKRCSTCARILCLLVFYNVHVW